MTEEQWRGQRARADLVPPNAPFDEEQRAWLNGFLAGLLGLGDGEPPRGPAAANAERPSRAAFRDPALPLERRLELSQSDPLERRLMSALGQLDCGQCGFSCEGYAQALAAGSERQVNLCRPGGRATARALRTLLAEAQSSVRDARARVAGGAAARRARALTPSVERVAAPREPVRESSAAGAGPERVRVKSQRRLTLADAGSEIREVVLDLEASGLRYRTGDRLAIFPHNDPDLVRAVLRALGARGQELVSTTQGPSEVWRCLLESLDITHPGRETLELFARSATAPAEARAVEQLLAAGVSPGFDLLDLAALAPSARPSLDEVVSSLGALSPRIYAITSSPSAHPGEAHLAVRMIRAERGGRERKGVASTFLTEGLFKGDELYAGIHSAGPFAPPEDRQGPLIMLGTGTGIARYRAFLEELEARGWRGNTWLILAGSVEGDEALYQAELAAWSRMGVLEHVDVVKPSRNGRRSGPEDALRKRARRAIAWLSRGAFVYACGEDRALPGTLAEALIEMLGRHGKMSRSDAHDLVHGMRRDGRYVEEVF